MFKLRSFLITFFIFSASILLGQDGKGIVGLKTNYMEEPIELDSGEISFSWRMESNRRGVQQEAYQIRVFDEKKKQMWNSKKVNSDISHYIEYKGDQLLPRTRYLWEVLVWDQEGNEYSGISWFETGLKEPDEDKAWKEASWIGGANDDLPFYSDYLSVFKIAVSFKFEEGSTKGGILYGVNDPRLLNTDKNHLGIENKKDDSYINVQLDISPLKEGRNAIIHLLRKGYVKDEGVDEFRIEIPAELINEGNKYEEHKILISSVFGETDFYIDGEGKDSFVGHLNLNPNSVDKVGGIGDFPAYPVVSEIGFRVPAGNKLTFSNLEIRNYRNPSNVLFEEGFLDKPFFSEKKGLQYVNDNTLNVDAKHEDFFISANPSRKSSPILRTEFDVKSKKIKRVRLYVTARGVYEFYINGKRVSDSYLAPGSTQYNRTHLYQTFDVTDKIKSGLNAMGAVLGEGWWSGAATYQGWFWNYFGDRQSLLSKLIITYVDGTERTFATNPETWKYFGEGPMRYGSLFQGEVYDARLDSLVQGWSTIAFDDSAWQGATEIELKNTISHSENKEQVNMPRVDDYLDFKLVGDPGPAVECVDEVNAISVEQIRSGAFIYDFGQNFAGVPMIKLSNNVKKGDTIVLRYAEMKYPNRPEYGKNRGMIMTENLRAAMVKDIYIANGTPNEIIEPRFTFHGYRYIEITGISSPLPLKDVKSRSISSLHELTSYYETSDSLVNRLWKNIIWSARSNFLSIPTDTPGRNERLGWSGDISVFSETATYLSNVSSFLDRHMRAMRDLQRKDGRFPDIAPIGGGFGGVLWGCFMGECRDYSSLGSVSTIWR